MQMIKKKRISEFFIKYKLLIFVIFTTIMRIPHYLRADFRLDSDGAHHWIVMENIINKSIFALHPYGVNHLGVTDFLIAIPISLFTGHNQYAYQAMLHIVFLLLSYTLYKITDLCFGRDASLISLILLALPNPIIFHFLVRPYGGHVLSIILMLASLYLLFISNKEENRILKLSLASFFLGLGYYTSHLSIIIALPLSIYLIIYLFIYRKFSYLVTVLFTFILGISPSIIGTFIQPYPVSYFNASFNIKIERIFDNLTYSIKYIFPSIFGYFSLPGIEESGFYPSKDLQLLFPILTIFTLFSFFYFLYIVYRKKLYYSSPENKILGNYFLFSLIVVALNILAILTTSNGLEGFGVRFFIPAIITIIPLYSAFLSGKIYQNSIWGKEIFRKILLYLHIIVFLISYGRGYLNYKSPLYTFEATPKIKELVEVLKNNNVKFCAADYWISNPIVYETKFKILASPIENLTSGPFRNPEISKKIMDNPNGIECIINLIFAPLKISSKSNDVIEINSYKFKLINTITLDKYIIHIVKELK